MAYSQHIYDEPPEDFPPPPPPVRMYDDDEFIDEVEDPYETFGQNKQKEFPVKGYVEYRFEIGSKGRNPGQFGGWIQHFTVSDDASMLYACDVFNKRIQIISLSDRKYRHSFPTNIAQYNFQARGIAVLRGGNLCVNCVGFDGTSRIGIFTPEGRVVNSFGQGIIGSSSAMTVDNMDRITVVDRRKMKVLTLSKDGQGLGAFVNPVQKDSLRICSNSRGNLLISDHLNNMIWLCDENGNIIKKVVPPGGPRNAFHYPAGVSVDCEDNIFVCDVGNHCVTKFKDDGDFYGKVLTKSEHSLWRPHDVVATKRGQLLVSEVGKTYIKVMNFTS